MPKTTGELFRAQDKGTELEERKGGAAHIHSPERARSTSSNRERSELDMQRRTGMVDVDQSGEAKIAELQQDNRDIWDAIGQLHDLHDRQELQIIYTMKNNIEFAILD